MTHNYHYFQIMQVMKTPLHYACASGIIDSVKPLLKCCSNEGFVNATDDNVDTALHISTRSGFIEIMKMLRKNKANPKGINLIIIGLHGANFHIIIILFRMHVLHMKIKFEQ